MRIVCTSDFFARAFPIALAVTETLKVGTTCVAAFAAGKQVSAIAHEVAIARMSFRCIAEKIETELVIKGTSQKRLQLGGIALDGNYPIASWFLTLQQDFRRIT